MPSDIELLLKLQAIDYDLGENVEGERYLKFEITDNIESFENGEKVWKSVAFKPVSYEIRKLKNCPKSLK